MFAKKRGYLLLILLLILPTVVALSGTFYWYDAGGVGGSCHSVTKPGEAANTEFTDPFPFQIAGCCDFQGLTKVKYCADSACSAQLNAYSINWDGNQQSCQCFQKTWFDEPSKYDTGTLPSCCGDDLNEYYITYLDRHACCTNPAACIDKTYKCGYETPSESTCDDGIDNDCDKFFDCDDSNCRGINAEQHFYTDSCRNGKDDDCDGCTDCSDTDCALSLDCIGYVPEDCTDGVDNDGDNYIDCDPQNRDVDCVRCFGTNYCADCEDPPETQCADDIDNDCDGKTDCSDTDCIGEACDCTTTPENPDAKNCKDGVDNDCDGLTDYLDHDCLGCPKGTKICNNGECKEACDPDEPQGCLGSPNGDCEEGEGCACEDCFGKRDSCEIELRCDASTKVCTCPPGTKICLDGRCRVTCHVCGNGAIEPGEECDGSNFGYLDQCMDIDDLYLGGTLSCNTDCLLDTSSCTIDTVDSDGDGLPDWWEEAYGLDPNDPSDALEDPDGDGLNNWEEYLRGTDPNKADTDGDGLNDKVDPCPLDSSNQCFTVDSDGDGLPDWWEDAHGLDPNKVDTDGDGTPDNEEDPDGDGLNNWEEYLRGTDPNKADTDGDGLNDKVDPCPLGPCNNKEKCGNNIIDPGETCDGTNLDGKTCASIFNENFKGNPTCLYPEEDNSCHFDTSDCYLESPICGGASCTAEKDCSCTECIGQTDSCSYGSICDITAKCACIDGTTLCKDSTCRSTQNCETYGKGEQTCILQDNVCVPGEGCGCADCEGEKGPCSYTSVCMDGLCTGCFLSRTYWSDPERGTEIDCIGGNNDIDLVVEGTMACNEKTVNFTVYDEEDESVNSINALFIGSKATATWKAKNTPGKEVDYYFIAKLSSGDSIGGEASSLEVRDCIPECDADCDGCCDGEKIQDCKTNHPGYCGEQIDENPHTPWCEEVDENCLSAGQSTCVALYDCTSGWWERQGENRPSPSDWPESTPGTVWEDAYIKRVLEWSECGEGETNNRYTVQSDNRYRLICPLELSKDNCCQTQANCYCKIPEEAYCMESDFRPVEEKSCLSEEKFPFFTNMNILIVVLILTGFYIWKTRKN